MKCNHCLREIEDSAKICPYCHTPIIRIKPKKICGYCYTELKKGDKTCKGCGRKIPEELLKIWEEEKLENAGGDQEPKKESEKREILLFSKRGGEEQQSSPDLEFLCLMLSICPPLAAIIFRLVFSSTGFLPWPLTLVMVYCLSSMALAYFLEGNISSSWEKEKGRALGEGYRSFFYLCPPLTLHFLLKEKEGSQLSFFIILHLALFALCFLPFY